MQSYGRNKFRTAYDIVRRIDNWPAAIGLRLQKRTPGLHLLRFREGLNVVCRGDSRDWDVIHELLFAGGYERAMNSIRNKHGPATVLDLGGNIGLFSLLAARQRQDVIVHAFEPGPPNYRLFEMNLLANPALSERIHLHREAVGGEDKMVNWFFDEKNPGGSSLYGTSGQSFPVRIREFSEVVNSIDGRIDLAKIDIEGSEYELLEKTPASTWEKVANVSLELHHDPSGKRSQAQFFERMKTLGYVVEEETVCSFFLRRAEQSRA